MTASPVRVDLDSWEYRWVNQVGIERFIANWGKRDAAWYDPSRMQDDRTAQVAGAACELATAKYLNRYWSGSAWAAEDHDRYRDLPDIAPDIEVKRIRPGRTSAAVRSHQVGKGLTLWVAEAIEPELRSVTLWGHIPYDVAWDLGHTAPYDNSGRTRLITIDLLAEPSGSGIGKAA